MTAFDALQKKYELEASLNNMREHLDEVQSSLPELKYQKRLVEDAALNARGGLKQLLNRLRGKEDASSEAMERSIRTAAAALEAAQRDRAALEHNIAVAQEEWESLGEKQALMEALSQGEKDHFLRLEASLCAETALHHLRKCRKELEQAQYYARNPMMAVNDGYQENLHKANAGALAGKCREKLEQIHRCGFAFPIHPYIQNPMGYIVSAQRYGDQDKMNAAQKGIKETEAALKELLLQLTE